MAKWAERKTKPASPSKGHVIPPPPSAHIYKDGICCEKVLSVTSGSEQTYALFIVGVLQVFFKCKLFLQLAVLHYDDWWYFMLMTLIRSRLQAESWNHSIVHKFKIICDFIDFTSERDAYVRFLCAFILWITRTHIREMIVRSNLGWFLCTIL